MTQEQSVQLEALAAIPVRTSTWQACGAVQGGCYCPNSTWQACSAVRRAGGAGAEAYRRLGDFHWARRGEGGHAMANCDGRVRRYSGVGAMACMRV